MPLDKIKTKLTFSGHDTFHCRQLWLKKGYDFLHNGGSFTDPFAVVELGVGKNMVSSIQFWMKAFGLIDTNNKLTEFATYLFDKKGKDPYLEDEATLWLLHYKLVTLNVATLYGLLFNEIRREKIEFTKEAIISFVNRKTEELEVKTINQNTLSKDIDVLVKMYLPGHSKQDKDDIFSGLLTELALIQEEKRKVDDKTWKTFYSIVGAERSMIPDEIILFAILENQIFENSISLYSLEHDQNMIGNVFTINRTGLIDRIDNIAKNKKFKKYGIVFSDQAGVRELQLKMKPNPLEILNSYYVN